MIIEELYTLFLKHRNVSIDSRKVSPDGLFFALKGDNFNGNQFASAALLNGASYAVVDDPKLKNIAGCILVDDVLETLQKLANLHRKEFKFPVVALTGSNGKTTTKELIYNVLSKTFNVGATKGNLNNHIGVPLTLLSFDDSLDFAIVEMGANHIGEIDSLCRIAEPDYGLITNIGKAHLEGFGSFEGVIKAKTELYHYIEEKGKGIFYNHSNGLLRDAAIDLQTKLIPYATEYIETMICGIVEESNPFLNSILFEPKNQKEVQIQSKLIGKYNLENIVAAFAIGHFFGMDISEIQNGIESYRPENSRSELRKTNRNELVLDAYNANPTSMSLAINNFHEINSDLQKVLILGDMLELGEYAKDLHQSIIDLIEQNNFSEVFLVGEVFSTCKSKFKSFKNSQELKVELEHLNLQKRLILIKGSRGIKLEEIIETL